MIIDAGDSGVQGSPVMPPDMSVGLAIVGTCIALVVIAAVTEVAAWVRALAGLVGSAGLVAFLLVHFPNLS